MILEYYGTRWRTQLTAASHRPGRQTVALLARCYSNLFDIGILPELARWRCLEMLPPSPDVVIYTPKALYQITLFCPFFPPSFSSYNISPTPPSSFRRSYPQRPMLLGWLTPSTLPLDRSSFSSSVLPLLISLLCDQWWRIYSITLLSLPTTTVVHLLSYSSPSINVYGVRQQHGKRRRRWKTRGQKVVVRLPTVNGKESDIQFGLYRRTCTPKTIDGPCVCVLWGLFKSNRIPGAVVTPSRRFPKINK